VILKNIEDELAIFLYLRFRGIKEVYTATTMAKYVFSALGKPHFCKNWLQLQSSGNPTS